MPTNKTVYNDIFTLDAHSIAVVLFTHLNFLSQTKRHRSDSWQEGQLALWEQRVR